MSAMKADDHPHDGAATQFVVLLHSTDGSSHDRPTHWDFMIELTGADSQSALRTWALESEPQAGVLIQATELPPHRLEFLDYEGPVSGDRGSVKRVDRGHYRILEDSQRELRLQLAGVTIRGTATLQRVEGGSGYVFSLVDV